MGLWQQTQRLARRSLANIAAPVIGSDPVLRLLQQSDQFELLGVRQGTGHDGAPKSHCRELNPERLTTAYAPSSLRVKST